MKTRITILLTLLFISFGCAAPQRVYKPITLPRPAEKAPQAMEESEVAKTTTADYESLKTPLFEKTLPKKELPLRLPIDPKRLALTENPVMINVEKMPLSDFVIYALGETLRVSFIMDETTMNNKQPVTMGMPQAMLGDKALEVVLGLFERYGLYAEEKAGALYILSKPPQPKEPFDVRIGREAPDSPVDILQVIPLRHIRTYEIEPLIREMYKTGVQIKPYGKENVLILYGQAFQVKQIIGLVETFDVPYLQNKRLFLLKLTYWQTEEFISQLSKILESLGFSIARSPKDPGPLFLPIKQLNSVLVVSPDENTSKYILEWRDKLDTAESAGTEEKSYTYIPQYSNAAELVASIQKLYGVAPAAEPAQKPEAGRPAAPRIPSAQAVLQPGMKIAADETKNIIIIVASPAVYKNILNLLKGLDTPPKQVLIEATIAELILVDELKFGLEWFINNTLQGGPYSVRTLGQLDLSSGAGLTYRFLSETGKLQVILNAFAKEDRANILATPRLMVLDNKEATIQIGDDVPVVTGEVTTAEAAGAAGTGIVRSIQYRNTGIIIRVKPIINTEGLLTLDISQEVSKAGAGSYPIISTRRINTTVVVANGQTLALGGLMRESRGTVVNKVPLLGDVPLIGHLFKTTSKSTDKTELIILVTPTILTTTDNATKITDELRKELKWFK